MVHHQVLVTLQNPGTRYPSLCCRFGRSREDDNEKSKETLPLVSLRERHEEREELELL